MNVFGVRIAFSFSATVIAAVVISFPLMYRNSRGAFEQVDTDLVYAARPFSKLHSFLNRSTMRQVNQE